MSAEHITPMISKFWEVPILAAAGERFAPPFSVMAVPVALTFLGLAGWAIHKKGISFGQPGDGAFIRRSQRPLAYWSLVIGLVLAALFIVFLAGMSVRGAPPPR